MCAEAPRESVGRKKESYASTCTSLRLVTPVVANDRREQTALRGHYITSARINDSIVGSPDHDDRLTGSRAVSFIRTEWGVSDPLAFRARDRDRGQPRGVAHALCPHHSTSARLSSAAKNAASHVTATIGNRPMRNGLRRDTSLGRELVDAADGFISRCG